MISCRRVLSNKTLHGIAMRRSSTLTLLRHAQNFEVYLIGTAHVSKVIMAAAPRTT